MFAVPLLAQSPNGVINGLVNDPSNRIIVGADVVVANDVTGVHYATKTNGEGIYVVPNLPPGPYRLQVSKVGFKTLIKPDIVLNVQEALSINFTLPVGALYETVTVEGGAPLVNTESAAVSTVVVGRWSVVVDRRSSVLGRRPNRQTTNDGMRYSDSCPASTVHSIREISIS